MSKHNIILISKAGYEIAQTIQKEIAESQIISTSKFEAENTTHVESIAEWFSDNFHSCESLIFIGAVGIAVRMIAPHIGSKYEDPAVISVDSIGQFAISLLSGHVGGANNLTDFIAHTIGAEAVITTRSDTMNLWALDTIAERWGWSLSYSEESLNRPLTTFVNGGATALLLDVRDDGTAFLERTKPEHVEIFYSYEKIDLSKYDLLIAVTPYIYPQCSIDTLCFHPQILHLGVGCRKDAKSEGIGEYIDNLLKENRIASNSIKAITSIELKKDEALLYQLKSHFKASTINIFSSEELEDIEVPNPSERVKENIGVVSVAESSAICSSLGGKLLIEKQKGVLNEGSNFTFAVAIEPTALRMGHIEIVGAGPGDPDLVSVRGRHFLEAADLILYAGSLVPIELTHCAKEGAVVRSSASMNLEEQFEIMKEFYDRGLLVVRLHTGDPCIYGAIQEQMAFFDEYNMSYHITPGISSFLAAAAALRSQFTIPEKVQTIILTRGEGRTMMPEKEKLHLLARSQSTMCIFLSASIVDDVQRDLLEHYPPETPIAACYKLTWKDERIYRGELRDLSKIIKENNLTLTTMIVVGEAIDNRKGLSRLYADSFKHLFRK